MDFCCQGHSFLNCGLKKLCNFHTVAEYEYQSIVLIYLHMIYHVVPEPFAEFNRQGFQFFDLEQEASDGICLFHFVSTLGLNLIQLLLHSGVAGQVVVIDALVAIGIHGLGSVVVDQLLRQSGQNLCLLPQFQAFGIQFGKVGQTVQGNAAVCNDLILIPGKLIDGIQKQFFYILGVKVRDAAPLLPGILVIALPDGAAVLIGGMYP